MTIYTKISGLILALLFIASCEHFNNENKDEEPSNELGICDELYPPLDTIIPTHTSFTKGNYKARIKVFMADTIKEGDIVMLGNSLTEKGGNWNNKLGHLNVKNRGIAGDNTDGVLARLNELICQNPSKVFIMIGTNDLFLSYTSERIVQNIDSIGTILVENTEECNVYVQTIMPLGAGNAYKSKLVSINDLLMQKTSAGYEIIDTYSHMADENGDLPEAYTYDGVHLSEEGYAKWVEMLSEYLIN